MDSLLTTAASGLRARLETLDLLANNMANANTVGFKADREAYGAYFSPDALDGPEASSLAVAPVVERAWTDHSQGPLLPTGNPLDVALAGDGYFVIERGDASAYTRNGAFALSPDGDLITMSGQKVLDTAQRPIRLNSAIVAEIKKDGSIWQDGAAVAKLGIVSVADPTSLTKRGETYLSVNSAGGSAIQPSTAIVHQGRLEGANFSPAESAVGLVNVMRQFETLQRAIGLGSDLNRRAIEEVGKIRD